MDTEFKNGIPTISCFKINSDEYHVCVDEEDGSILLPMYTDKKIYKQEGGTSNMYYLKIPKEILKESLKEILKDMIEMPTVEDRELLNKLGLFKEG